MLKFCYKSGNLLFLTQADASQLKTTDINLYHFLMSANEKY